MEILKDQELDVLASLAAPMAPGARADFIKLVVGQLAAYPAQARGPGLVHRLAVEAQRDFIGLAVGPGSKYGRGRR